MKKGLLMAEPLCRGLKRAGFRAEETAYFSLLGVALY